MACLLFVYARTSIGAAKRNAQKHREADGGQISWHNENLRRHGKLDAPEPQNTVKQLLGRVGEKPENIGGKGVSEEELRIRELTRGSGKRE